MEKHKTNNPHGRPKGKPNKITADLRQRIKIFLEGKFDTIEKDFISLSPERRIMVFERYLKYVLPALQANSLEFNLAKLSDAELDKLLNHIIKKNHDKENLSTGQEGEV